MSMFKAEEVWVLSELEGTVTENGTPLPGAKVLRDVSWRSPEHETQETVTDERGQFSLPELTGQLRQILPSEFVAHQRIFIEHNGTQVQVWGMGKRSKEPYGEWGKKPLNFRCELTKEPVRVDLPRGFAVTSCKWD